MECVISKSMLRQTIEEAYLAYKDTDGGHNADYIPFLDNIDSNLFGICICLEDGDMIEIGDTDFLFGIESVSKVHTAILVMRQVGVKTLLDKIGADATGLPFNSIEAILLEKNHPSSPLVNAGAISACSMVEPIGDGRRKWNAIVDNIAELCASKPEIIQELYKSESATNFNNKSIAWLLKTYGRIYDDPSLALELYTKQCSLGVTARQLAISAATIAFDGMNPVSKKQVFDADITTKIVSLISTVGFYETTGDWLYTSGIPAKTGVGGAIMGVVPGLFGICAFSPPLDEFGNSVRAQQAIKYIANSLGINIFSSKNFAVALDDDPQTN